jgi:hypothetical protein
MITKDEYESLVVGSKVRLKTRESLNNIYRNRKNEFGDYYIGSRQITNLYEIRLLGQINKVIKSESKVYHNVYGMESVNCLSDYLERELIEEVICLSE